MKKSDIDLKHSPNRQSEEVLVSLRDVGANRGGRWTVHGVSFEISRREIVTLIGPNGSGKSTTAKMALGVEVPDQGQVTRASGLKVGYVPQKLFVEWTVPLTVQRLMTLTVPLSEAEISRALERTGVLPLLKSEVKSLSGGELQRVLIARAIAQKPDLLVLDEPAQGVDFSGAISLYELISEIRDELGCGILIISHDLNLVMSATDKVICLNGHMCCHGTPKAVSENQEYLNLFGARAASALAVYEHSHDHEHLPDGRVRHLDGTISDHCHHEDDHVGHNASLQTSEENTKVTDHVG